MSLAGSHIEKSDESGDIVPEENLLPMDLPKNKAVCAIMVTYNRLDTLKVALSHVFEQAVQPAWIIIVDNNSLDGTKDYLASIDNTKNIHCIFLSANVGAGGGYYYAMKYALENGLAPDCFWMIEDDTYYDKNTLSELIHGIETSDYDMISLKGFKPGFGGSKKLFTYDSLKPVVSVLLDGSLIKAAIIKEIGPPKKDYFMMCDDYEFSLRLKKHGYKVALSPTQSVNYLHLGGGGKFTTSTLWRGYYSARNHLLILREYFSLIQLLSYTYKQLKYLVAAALYAPDRKTRLKFRLLGIWHGILGVKGKTLDPATLTFIKNSGNAATAQNHLMITQENTLVRSEKIAARIVDQRPSSKPLITIITPTYNRWEMVQATIKSVINQTFKNWELIVIDDGSTDNTEAAVQQFLDDPRISYHKKPNTGQADSLNVGTGYASGEFITFLDSDDEAYPNWLEVVSKNIKEDTCVVTVAARRKLLDGTITYENIDNFRFSGQQVRLKITCGSLFIRRQVFADIGGYDPEMKSNIQTDLAYRLLTYLKKTNGKIVPVDEYLVQINIHPGPRIRTDWRKRRDGTIHFLEKNYNYILENSPQDIASAYAIIAFSSYKLKERRESLRYLFKVIRLKPFVLTNYLKIIKYAFL